jgi:aspartate carbamoyltransferase regulatory subunit
MLNIDKIKNGIVIDHIKAGQGIRIFNWLGLHKASYTVAFVINANSQIMGVKDIVKIDNTIDVNFNILGFIDPDITVNVIKNEIVFEKIKIRLPCRIENVLLCKNPRCITSCEKNIPHAFVIHDEMLHTYRCEYCDDIAPALELRNQL